MAFTVLVVEDDMATLRLFLKCLKKAGFDATGAVGLKDARIQLSQRAFDVLLCDMRLEDGEGTALLIEQQENAMNGITKMMVVSAESQYKFISEELGAIFISKPLLPSSLVNITQRLLNIEP